MRTHGKLLFTAAFVPAIAFAICAKAADVMRTKTVGAYRVELHVLPAEPFFSKEDVAAKQVKEGMEIEGGAAPVMADAPSHPIIISSCTSSIRRPAKLSPTRQ